MRPLQFVQAGASWNHHKSAWKRSAAVCGAPAAAAQRGHAFWDHSATLGIRTCCGWSFGHSRGPAVVPRCARAVLPGRNLLAWPIPVVYTRRIPAKQTLTRVTVGPFYTRRHKSTTPGLQTVVGRVPSRGGTFGVMYSARISLAWLGRERNYHTTHAMKTSP